MKVLIKILWLFLISLSAHASVEGLWSCTLRSINEITNVTNGKKIKTQQIVVDSQITFLSNGTFESTTSNLPVTGQGTWLQRGKTVVFRQDPVNAADNAEYGCSLVGTTCTVLSVANRLVGKELRHGLVIKGKTKLRLTMLLRGLMLRTEGEGKFICFR